MRRARVVYRTLVLLYPKEFRDQYADDMVQLFADLVRDRGIRRAWTRTGIDLIVTVPRYRLERMMNDKRSAATLVAVLGLLAVAGILTFLTGLWWGLLLLGAAVVLGLVQRGPLARAVQIPDSSRRRSRLSVAAALGVVFVGVIASFFVAISDEEISQVNLIMHNVVGMGTLVGAVGFLAAGLLTPKQPDGRGGAPAA